MAEAAEITIGGLISVHDYKKKETPREKIEAEPIKITSHDNSIEGDQISPAESSASLYPKELSSNKFIKEYNILILGESGVGKSTFINALANYLTYDSIYKALQASEPTTLIKSSFTAYDDDDNQIRIRTGNDLNERHEIGVSSTISVKAHEIKISHDILLRLIDTPGVGDTGGTEQDRPNIEQVLKYLTTIEDVHAILILLKPDLDRENIMFKYCLKELLIHLHKSALDNLIFCFTHSRATFYKSGSTLGLLKKQLEENPTTKRYNLTRKMTMFYFDNEAFRFLWAMRKVPSMNDQIDCYKQSWEKSVEETVNLINRITDLKPHKTADTIMLNRVRSMILSLTEPLARIDENNTYKISVAQAVLTDIRKRKSNYSRIQKDLYLVFPEIRVKPLEHPKLICTKPECAGYVKDPYTKEKRVAYKTVCHDHCEISGIAPESYPNPALKRCLVMTRPFLGFITWWTKCRKCGHYWDAHMHYTYDVSYEEVVVINNVPVLKLSKEKMIDNVEQFCVEVELTIVKLKNEQNIIRKAAARFAKFLERQALCFYNDSMREYLSVLITQQKEHVQNGVGATRLRKLEKQLADYEEEVKKLTEATRTNILFEDTKETLEDLREKLISLEYNGKEMEALIKGSTFASRIAGSKPEDFNGQRYDPCEKFGWRQRMAMLASIYFKGHPKDNKSVWYDYSEAPSN